MQYQQNLDLNEKYILGQIHYLQNIDIKELRKAYDILEKPTYHSCFILDAKQQTKSNIKINRKQRNG